MRPLKDQIIVITGASSDIGRETALRCRQRGAAVVRAARNEPAGCWPGRRPPGPRCSGGPAEPGGGQGP